MWINAYNFIFLNSYFMYTCTLTSGENQFVAQLIVEKSTHDIENLTKEKPFIHSTPSIINNTLRSLLFS